MSDGQKLAPVGHHLPQIWLKVASVMQWRHVGGCLDIKCPSFVLFSQYLAKKLGFDTLWFGYLQTTVGFIQLFGGPMFGRSVPYCRFLPANWNEWRLNSRLPLRPCPPAGLEICSEPAWLWAWRVRPPWSSSCCSPLPTIPPCCSFTNCPRSSCTLYPVRQFKHQSQFKHSLRESFF